MGIDIGKRLQESLEKGMTVWAEHPDIEGFRIEVSFISRDEMTKMYDKHTKREWDRKARRLVDNIKRIPLLKEWCERVILNWEGLMLKDVVRLIPIEVGKDEDPKSEVVCDPANKLALLRHNADFDQFILEVATDPEVFLELRREAEKQVKNLKQ